jgi:hypothetical protein
MGLKKILVTIIFFIQVIFLQQSHAAILSTIDYEGRCLELPQEQLIPFAAETGSEIIKSLASTVVKGTLTFISGWLSSFEKSFEGADTATSSDGFYCTSGKGKLGHKEFLTYKRVALSGDKSSAESLIVLKSRVEVFLQNGIPGNGVFTITPHQLNYSEPIAKRGQTKDLTVTYSFEILGDGNKWQTVAVDPFVLKSVKKGDKLTNLESYIGTTLVSTAPKLLELGGANSKKLQAPFKFGITVAESAVGNGVKLAGKISKELAATIEKDKDDLVSKIVGVIIDNEGKEEETAEGSSGN